VTLPPQRNAANEPVEEPGPSVTLVGSSNYTKRSYSLDLEIGAMIVTDDEGLKKKLKAETEWLQKDARVTTQDDLMKVDRRVGFKVRVAMWLVEKLGGAL
jgi:CDP-diacylglycerol--glycerol-3-phosphate 3-phosphatidyltransferase